MSEYYLDLETFSPTKPIDFNKDPIIAISYQQIDGKTGDVLSPLTILKSWETSEQDILKHFYQTFNIQSRWAFIPVGFKLADFDLIMLGTHWRKNGIDINVTSLYNHPFIDIYSTLLLCNGGEFKGCTLNKFAGKQESGANISEWFINKDYSTIENYIADEAQSFISLYSYFVKQMPTIWQGFKKDGSNDKNKS